MAFEVNKEVRRMCDGIEVRVEGSVVKGRLVLQATQEITPDKADHVDEVISQVKSTLKIMLYRNIFQELCDFQRQMHKVFEEDHDAVEYDLKVSALKQRLAFLIHAFEVI